MVIWVHYFPSLVLFGFKSLTILNKTVCCVRKRFSTESLLGKRQLLISSLKVSRSYFHLRALQWVTNTSKMFPNIAFAVIRVRPMYVGTIQKSLVTPLKPPATLVLEGTIPSGFEIVLFFRSRKWPATMVREGVTSGSWEIYQSKKPGKYLKVILSSEADPDLALRKGGGGGFLSLGLPIFLPSAIPFFFFTQNKEGRSGWVPRASSLDPSLLLQEWV